MFGYADVSSNPQAFFPPGRSIVAKFLFPCIITSVEVFQSTFLIPADLNLPLSRLGSVSDFYNEKKKQEKKHGNLQLASSMYQCIPVLLEHS